MKKFLILMSALVAMGISVKAADVAPELVNAESMAKASCAKVLAEKDNAKASEMLTAEIRAMVKDDKSEAVKAGAPELTLATLVKTDFERALQIIPATLLALTEGIDLAVYQRLVASALMAAGDGAAALTNAILASLSGKNRWVEVVMTVAKDTPRPLPAALRTAVQAISATVLPPAVIPPGPYEGQ